MAPEIGPINPNLIKQFGGGNKDKVEIARNAGTRQTLVSTGDKSGDKVEVSRSAQEIQAQNKIAASFSVENVEQAVSAVSQIRAGMQESENPPFAAHGNINRENVLSLLK